MLNVGVIGLGMGRAHLQGYSAVPDVRIAAIADLDKARLKASAQEYAIAKTFVEYRELLADPDIHAVSICLPNFLHATAAIEALQAGKHVLVEKPMAKSLQDAEAMLAAATQYGKTLSVSMNYRWAFGPDSLYLKELIDRGKLGKIYYIRAVSLRRRTDPGPTRRWFCTKQLSGGAALMDMGPHLIDLSMWLAGDFVPVSASGDVRTAIMVDTDVDDFATGLVRMQSGTTIAIESSWASFTQPGMTLTVLGTHGGAILNMSNPKGQRLTLFTQEGDTLLESKPVDILCTGPQEASVQEHFVRCLLDGRAPENSAEHGLAVMRVIDAIYRSAELGHDVVISPQPIGR